MNGYGYTHVHKSNEQDKKKEIFFFPHPPQKEEPRINCPIVESQIEI